MVDLSQLPVGVEFGVVTSFIVLILRFGNRFIPAALEERALASVLAFLFITITNRIKSRGTVEKNATINPLINKMHDDIILLRERIRRKKIIG